MELEELDEIVPSEDITEDSVIERLRKQRKKVAEQHFQDFDIPGYNGELFCRYNLLDGKQLGDLGDNIKRTIRDPDERALAAGCDVIIAACDEFWVRDRGKEIPVRSLLNEPQELPVKYDIRLAEFLAFTDSIPDPPTRRSIVLGLFGGNEISLAAHNTDVVRWMMGRGTEVDIELGGL
jgi:hypothetical protein